MEYIVKISPHAYEQINEAIDYIATKLQSPQSAQKLLIKIFDELNIIKAYPLSKPMVSWDELSGRYRKFFVNNYLGIYSINEQDNLINIVAFRYAPSSLGDRL